MTTFRNDRCRFCSRCGQPLTDYSSMECGVGPICRAKDNHLYSKTIAVNLPIASAIVLSIAPDIFPLEVQAVWTDAKSIFLRKMGQSQQQSDFVFVGADFREFVQKIDFLLSWRLPSGLRTNLIKIVEAVGYVGLASVLGGEASTSGAEVWFQNGRVFLRGKANKFGWRAFRSVPGVVRPMRRGDTTPYSAPATSVDLFLTVVEAYWPMYEGDFAAIRASASVWIEQNRTPLAPTVVPPPAVAAPPVVATAIRTAAQITHRSADLVVKFEWQQGKPMYAMIEAIKAIPNDERRYDPSGKQWFVRSRHLETVKRALRIVFDSEQISERKTSEITPLTQWGQRSTGATSTYYRR